MSPRLIPDPPNPFDPLVDDVDEPLVLYRLHHTTVLAHEANPRPGPGRWAPFGKPAVPVLYLASNEQAAVFETVLRDAVPGSVLPLSRMLSFTISQVVLEGGPLRLARFHSDGLARLGVLPESLTSTPASTYGLTARWAQSVHDAGLDGLTWMCHRYNSALAYALFADRALRLGPGNTCRDFTEPDDQEWLIALAERVGVTVGHL